MHAVATHHSTIYRPEQRGYLVDHSPLEDKELEIVFRFYEAVRIFKVSHASAQPRAEFRIEPGHRNG